MHSHCYKILYFLLLILILAKHTFAVCELLETKTERMEKKKIKINTKEKKSRKTMYKMKIKNKTKLLNASNVELRSKKKRKIVKKEERTTILNIKKH